MISLGSSRALVEVVRRSGGATLQSGRERKAEDKGTLELTVSKVINGVHGIPRWVSVALLLTTRKAGAQFTPSDLPAVS